MKMAYSILLIGGLFGMILSAGCAKKEVIIVKTPKTLVFFGDSIVYGYGVERETESFFSRIDKIMKTGMYGPVKTINAGLNGDDSSEALRRVTTDVTSHNPDIVIVALGLNDCQNRMMTVEKYRENITNIIAAMPSKTQVVLASSNTFLDTGNTPWQNLNEALEPFMKELQAIALEKKLRYIDVNDVWKTQLKQDSRHMESYYIDPTHPSAKGHGIIYETYMNVLRRLLVK